MSDIREISIDMIDDPELVMRSDVHDEDIESLGQSIKEHGLLEPLVVRPKGERFELIAGHRRLTACKIISKIMIPCTIRDVDDNAALILRIQENTHRLDVNPVDDAVYMAKMLDRTKWSVKELAGQMKRSEGFIYDRLSILDFPDYLIEAVGLKKIGIKAAQSLMKITDEPYRASLVEVVLKDGITADAADRWYQNWKLNLMPLIPTAEALAAIAGRSTAPETALQCAKCQRAGLIREMATVWIHRECPAE